MSDEKQHQQEEVQIASQPQLPAPLDPVPASAQENSPVAEIRPHTSAYTVLSPQRQRLILTLVTIAGFLGPFAGNIYLPALPVLEDAFHVTATEINVTVTVFMVVFAFGPLFWSSFADRGGRRPLYLSSLLVYIAANILLAVIPANYGALIVLRIVQAFGSAAVVSLGAGTVADITEPKKRGRAMSYFLFGPQCGPIFGPLIGGAIAGNTSWRWIFGFLAISGAVLWLALLFFLPETLRARVGNGGLYADKSWLLWPPRWISPEAEESARGLLPPKPTLHGYWRLFSYPPIGIACVNTALLYSSYFCIAIQLPSALEGVYGWSTSAVGAGYVVVGVAMIIGSMAGGRFSDWQRTRLEQKLGAQRVTPEMRLDDQIWGLGVASVGLICFGFFVRYSIHPAATLIATFLVGFGMSWMFVASNSFLTFCVAQQAAGAFALGNMLRSPGAAVAAVVVGPLVQRMGWGYCFLGLALLDLLAVGSMLVVLRTQSPRWRRERNARNAKTQRPGQ
ncbi:putative bicyclomycin resistance protein [Aspergillus fijiensis CBS 313.89]|uniref:Citrate exporter 1 n=1 Tax=Aspergillus fijiensis CBS 313.89 TaxID=1448319 RepID=A0A8G1S1N2_9EURO|nr:putative bicyclomycin resistance protein [Aspergillus fijiensis CBS 313.89]RAK81745.1 putative bicyclomycin resistance protein [Aspergillus fijiensis CBS 313.89]